MEVGLVLICVTHCLLSGPGLPSSYPLCVSTVQGEQLALCLSVLLKFSKLPLDLLLFSILEGIVGNGPTMAHLDENCQRRPVLPEISKPSRTSGP